MAMIADRDQQPARPAAQPIGADLANDDDDRPPTAEYVAMIEQRKREALAALAAMEARRA
jgi:hypothetical protein